MHPAKAQIRRVGSNVDSSNFNKDKKIKDDRYSFCRKQIE